jgi:hypothetical protein
MQHYLVGICAAAYCYFIRINIFGIIAALFVYPHFMFIKEVRQGIMRDKNYHNE